MAQFDVYANPNPNTNKEIPYLLDVQADILSSLETRVVVPLVIQSKTAKHLNPVFEVKNKKVVMSTSQIAGVPLSVLGEKVANLKDKRAEIIAAIDFLITGF
ncbi:MAG: CcdB family protein [Campylobacteraceae bacterium]|nr:CcdB family protein [Campylobacteraceae bacterium]